MKISLLGAPGCGKGTQGKLISEYYNIPHISTGELFRQNISNHTPLGDEAKKYIDSGALVPDSITIDMLNCRISKDDCKNGYILDGFPRTVKQAEEFLSKNNLDKVLYFNVKDSTIIERIKNRRTCAKCGAIYSTLMHSSMQCDNCGGDLIIRPEDNRIDARIDAYYKDTFPLVDYYQQVGLLTTIDMNNLLESEPGKQIAEIFSKIKAILGDK